MTLNNLDSQALLPFPNLPKPLSGDSVAKLCQARPAAGTAMDFQAGCRADCSDSRAGDGTSCQTIELAWRIRDRKDPST